MHPTGACARQAIDDWSDGLVPSSCKSLPEKMWTKFINTLLFPSGQIDKKNYCCLVTPHGEKELGQHWRRQWAFARYVKLRVGHAPGMPGTFSPPLRVSDPDMHHGTCVTHVPRCTLGSLTSGLVWIRWRGKCSRHFRRMRNPQFGVSGKRPMAFFFAWRHQPVLTR